MGSIPGSCSNLFPFLFFSVEVVTQVSSPPAETKRQGLVRYRGVRMLKIPRELGRNLDRPGKIPRKIPSNLRHQRCAVAAGVLQERKS